MTDPSRFRRIPWLKFFKLVLGGLVFVFVLRFLGRAFDDLRGRGISGSDIRWPWVALSMACYLTGMLPMGWFWHRILLAVGERPSLATTLRAFFIGHLGKYVPGKAAVLLLRMSFLHGEYTSIPLVTVSVFVETLTMMAVGAGCAALFLIAEMVTSSDPHPLMLLLALGMACIAGIPTIPALLRLVVARLGRNRAGQATLASALQAINGRLIAVGWLLNFPGWLLLGLSYWAAIRSLPLPGLDSFWLQDYPRTVASVGLSMVAGFLSMLPGGLGVRELVLRKLMEPSLDETAAIIAAVWLRLIWLVAEAGIAGIMMLGRATRGAKSPQPPPPSPSASGTSGEPRP